MGRLDHCWNWCRQAGSRLYGFLDMLMYDPVTFSDLIEYVEDLVFSHPWKLLIVGVVIVFAGNRQIQRRKRMREREEYERIYPTKRK